MLFRETRDGVVEGTWVVVTAPAASEWTRVAVLDLAEEAYDVLQSDLGGIFCERVTAAGSGLPCHQSRA